VGRSNNSVRTWELVLLGPTLGGIAISEEGGEEEVMKNSHLHQAIENFYQWMYLPLSERDLYSILDEIKVAVGPKKRFILDWSDALHCQVYGPISWWSNSSHRYYLSWPE
jgi:hypothetical protein